MHLFIVFSFLIISNLSTNKGLESEADKKKVVQKNIETKKKELQKKIDEIPELEKKLAKLKASEIIFQNVKFWPGLLEALANSLDDYSQLTNVTTDSDESVTIQGITLKVLKMQELVDSLESDEDLKVAILEKSVSKERVNDNDLWSFTIKLSRQQ